MVVCACVSGPAGARVTGLAIGHHRKIGVTLLACGRRGNRLMMEGRCFTRVTRLAIVVLTRQTARVTVGASQTSTFHADHIVVLGFS